MDTKEWWAENSNPDHMREYVADLLGEAARHRARADAFSEQARQVASWALEILADDGVADSG